MRRKRGHLLLAERALAAIEIAALTRLGNTPFLFREAGGSALRRELLAPSVAAGYVVLYEIAGPALVVALAARHQREEDDP